MAVSKVSVPSTSAAAPSTSIGTRHGSYAPVTFSPRSTGGETSLIQCTRWSCHEYVPLDATCSHTGSASASLASSGTVPFPLRSSFR